MRFFARLAAFALWLVPAATALGYSPQEKLDNPALPMGMDPYDDYGAAIAIGGGHVVVGAPGDDASSAFDDHGKAWIWYPLATAPDVWVAQELSPTSSSLHGSFGKSVDLTDVTPGQHIIVGAPGEQYAISGVTGDYGAAYVFEKGSVPVQLARLAPWSSPGDDDLFGRAVAIANDIALVGAPGADKDAFNIDQGKVYIFETVDSPPWYSGNRTAIEAPLGSSAAFGQALDFDGSTAIIGAPNYSTTNTSSTRYGAAFIHVRENTSPPSWPREDMLYPEAADREVASLFGYSVAVDGDRAVVGAPRLSVSGAAFVFRRTSAGWEQEAKLEGDGGVNEEFGFSVSISGTRIAVGARYDDDAASDAGAVYRFVLSGGSWRRAGKVTAPDATADAHFGASVALDGCDMAVGADRGFTKTFTTIPCGAAYVWDLDCIAVKYCLEPGLPCPCGNNAPNGCRNSTGFAATLAASGTTSVVMDDLVLTGRRLPGGSAGILIMGGTSISPIPFRDGVLCLASGGTGIRRFALASASGAGVIAAGPGLVARSQSMGTGAIDPGETRFFQVWYRDSGGPCGTKSNLTNGVVATFEP